MLENCGLLGFVGVNFLALGLCLRTQRWDGHRDNTPRDSAFRCRCTVESQRYSKQDAQIVFACCGGFKTIYGGFLPFNDYVLWDPSFWLATHFFNPQANEQRAQSSLFAMGRVRGEADVEHRWRTQSFAIHKGEAQ